MVAITAELAQRLEVAEAADGADCAEAQHLIDPETDAAVLAVAGGYAVYAGVASPLTHALGIGMHGAVKEADIVEIEEFFSSRSSAITVDICPYADPTLLELLNARRYRPVEFSNVLVRAIDRNEVLYGSEPGVTAREAAPHEGGMWARTTVAGFFGRDSLNEEEERLGEILFRMPGSKSLFGLVEGEYASAASVSFRAGVASCFGDSTLVRFRRRGAHRATIRERIRLAALAGCDVITAGTQPGSGSQRDFERFGFQVAYTKITMTKG